MSASFTRAAQDCAGVPKLRKEIARAAGRGFTLLEVLIAIAVLGIAMLALLSLEHQDLQSVVRGQEMTRAAMLAQAVMTQAELERFPPLGTSSGNFDQMYAGQYPGFRWTRSVEPSGNFPDLRKVEIHVIYGPRLGRDYGLVEFLHNPVPQLATPQSQAPQNPALQGSQPPAEAPGAAPVD
ncbi:MAG TPA: type II secretion system minor pseudopilin GspI [Candidatus Binataceae bacterium]|nr:type II secretion system minor pseudopilin GspI [Candidatus Binataceae bacterium]